MIKSNYRVVVAAISLSLISIASLALSEEEKMDSIDPAIFIFGQEPADNEFPHTVGTARHDQDGFTVEWDEGNPAETFENIAEFLNMNAISAFSYITSGFTSSDSTAKKNGHIKKTSQDSSSRVDSKGSKIVAEQKSIKNIKVNQSASHSSAKIAKTKNTRANTQENTSSIKTITTIDSPQKNNEAKIVDEAIKIHKSNPQQNKADRYKLIEAVNDKQKTLQVTKVKEQKIDIKSELVAQDSEGSIDNQSAQNFEENFLSNSVSKLFGLINNESSENTADDVDKSLSHNTEQDPNSKADTEDDWRYKRKWWQRGTPVM